jgi:hypothetical protein
MGLPFSGMLPGFVIDTSFSRSNTASVPIDSPGSEVKGAAGAHVDLPQSITLRVRRPVGAKQLLRELYCVGKGLPA